MKKSIKNEGVTKSVIKVLKALAVELSNMKLVLVLWQKFVLFMFLIHIYYLKYHIIL